MSEPPASGARDRNRARIVEAAQRLWVGDPDASMDAVAQVAGVVRRTLYGHFATRDDLVVAVAARAADFIDDFVAADPDCSPTERLAAMSNQLWRDGHQLRLLIAAAEQLDNHTVAAALARINHGMAAVIADGQRTGEFSDHLPPAAMAKAMEASAVALHLAAADGDWVGTADQVALAALIAAGVPTGKARKVLQRSGYRNRTRDPGR